MVETKSLKVFRCFINRHEFTNHVHRSTRQRPHKFWEVDCPVLTLNMDHSYLLTGDQFFVFGAAIRNTYLNVFIDFIGGSQHKLPRRNFAWFILMMFVMYSLVIRTLYQGSFFQLIQSGKRHKEVHTIDEMVANDFIFYVSVGISNIFQGSEATRNRWK